MTISIDFSIACQLHTTTQLAPVTPTRMGAMLGCAPQKTLLSPHYSAETCSSFHATGIQYDIHISDTYIAFWLIGRYRSEAKIEDQKRHQHSVPNACKIIVELPKRFDLCNEGSLATVRRKNCWKGRTRARWISQGPEVLMRLKSHS